MPTYGLLSSIGLFQTYWHGTVLRGSGHSEGDVAWVISVFGFLDCLFAAPAGVLLDRSSHGTPGRWPLLLLGCAAYVAAFAGLAWARTYAQFMGCMVVAGVAAGGFVFLLSSFGPIPGSIYLCTLEKHDVWMCLADKGWGV